VKSFEARPGGATVGFATPGPMPNQWVVPATDPGLAYGRIDVYLLTSAFTWLWDGDPIAPTDLAGFTVASTGATTYTLFGYKEPWGIWVADPSCTEPDPTLCPGTIGRHVRAKYLQSAAVTLPVGVPSLDVIWEAQLGAENSSHVQKGVDSFDITTVYQATSEPTPLL